MEKKIIAVVIASLKAAVVSLLALLQLYGALRENWKFKGNTEIYSLTFNSKLNSQYFVLELDILNVISLLKSPCIYKTFTTVNSNIRDLINTHVTHVTPKSIKAVY